MKQQIRVDMTLGQLALLLALALAVGMAGG